MIGAWQTKALTTRYLQDWLNVSSVHLKDIEEAAAPKGWQCEWDRYENTFLFHFLRVHDSLIYRYSTIFRNFAVKIIKRNLQEYYVTFIESRALLDDEAKS